MRIIAGKLKKLYTLLCFLMGFLPLMSYGWNAVGHKLVILIAYDHLTPQAKTQLDIYKTAFARRFDQVPNIEMMAIWPDVLAMQGNKRYSPWHYVDIPTGALAAGHAPWGNPNVVWAIGQAEQKIKDPNTLPGTKAKHLAFLIHFVGDIHQPLHCAERYSPEFPKGDRGGNALQIKAAHVKNLHSFWDQGLGLFGSFYKRYPPTPKQRRRIARRLEERYPMSQFKQQLTITDPKQWALEGYALAVKYAYPGVKAKQIFKANDPYVQTGREIAGRQIVLAGYRLAAVLNRVFA